MAVSNHSHRLDCFQSKFQRRYRRSKDCCSGKPEPCSPGKPGLQQQAGYNPICFPASRDHDRDAVLNLLFTRVSDYPGKPG